jgi:mannose-6-phosphate isomerase-like protein (cupin superfamily)
MESSQIVKDPVLRQRLRFTRDGDVLHVECWVDPGGGVTPHVHPAMEERFEVLEGRPSFLAGRDWTTAAPGQTVVVPPRTRHAYRNKTDEVVHMVCHATPPSTLQEFLEEAAALSRSGKITRLGIPRTPRAWAEGAALAYRHREMVTLLFPPMPPPPVQRVALPLLARFAR